MSGACTGRWRSPGVPDAPAGGRSAAAGQSDRRAGAGAIPGFDGVDQLAGRGVSGLARFIGAAPTGNEAPVAFGERVYAYFGIMGAIRYPPVSAWNSAACCQRLRTDCGGFSLVFTAACRANRIPARLLVGQCFKARELSDGRVALTDGRQAHVIAEFFDPQIGWIPEDISSTFLRTSGYPNLDFFGRDPGYFFAWHFDSDFHFDTPRKSDAHVQWIQNPNLWFSENADDANDTVSHHWDVERL